MIELFQTKSLKRSVEFEVLLEEFRLDRATTSQMIVQGIVFLPTQKNFPTPEIGMGWENLLPSDYEHFIYYSGKKMEKKSQDCVISESKEEAYNILSRGVYIKMGWNDIWFWITKSNGKKCFLISSRLICENHIKQEFIHSSKSRLKYVLESRSSRKIFMSFDIASSLFSANTSYACYLVYKIPEAFDSRPVYVETYRTSVGVTDASDVTFYYDRCVYLSNSQSRVVIGQDGAEVSVAPSTIINKLPTAQLPSKREDGWLEVRLFEFTTYDDPTIQNICPRWFSSKEDRWAKFHIVHAGYDHKFSITLTCNYDYFKDVNIPNLTMQGVEFRPL